MREFVNTAIHVSVMESRSPAVVPFAALVITVDSISAWHIVIGEPLSGDRLNPRTDRPLVFWTAPRPRPFKTSGSYDATCRSFLERIASAGSATGLCAQLLRA